MEWSEVEIHTLNEAVEPVANQLTEYGASGVSITDANDFHREREDKFGEIYALSAADYPKDGVVIKAYFLKTDEFVAQLSEMEEKVRALEQFDIPLGELRFQVNDVFDEDWATAWKKYYHPVQITENITVAPTWESYVAGQNEIVIELDPGMAFGTGTHPTTQLCLRAIETYLKKNDTVIDVGTGSGVLSILCAKLGAKEVLAMDLDEVAVRAAQENINQNQVEAIVTLKQNNLLEGLNERVDLIVANILAEVILLFPEDVYQTLKPGGIFIASGIIAEKKEVVLEAIVSAGLTIVQTETQGDWVAIIAKRGEA